MFKNIILIIQKNMSTMDCKSKQTLSKKLSAKRVPLKRDVVEKPELFSELKNNKRSKVASKKDESNAKIKLSAKDDSQESTSDSIELKKTNQRTGNKTIKKELNDEAPLEIISAGKSSNVKNELPEVETIGARELQKLKRTTRKKNIMELEPEDDALEKLPITNSSKINDISIDSIPTTSTGMNKKNIQKTKNYDKSSSEVLKELKKESIETNWEPTNWKLILDNIRRMRSTDKAPVDTMGCHKCADENADEKTQRFHKLVALMLSSQTKDETTYHAMLRLREHNLNPRVISEMKLNVLENILHPVSFYKNKAKYLQQTSKVLMEKYNSDIPRSIKELVALPGVGPKMAHICMSTAWNETTGIGVDVHVHRISNRLKWVPSPTKEPEQTRVALEQWLPRELWQEVNYLLVGFGQTTCTPVKPKCLECLNCDICPSAIKPKTSKEKTEKAEVLKICDKATFKKKKMHL